MTKQIKDVARSNGASAINGLLPLHSQANEISLPELEGRSIRKVFISPEKAALILDKYCYQGQRNLRPLEVARYARLMKLGRWNVHEIRVCILGGKKFLTDGQHRLNAVIMCGIGQTFTLHEIHCEDESEVARDYNTSGGGIPRTQADEMRASGIEQKLELPKAHLSAYTAAIKIILTEFSPKGRQYLNAKDSEELNRAMVEHERLFMLYLDAVRGAHHTLGKILRWSGAVSVALITFQADKAEAEIFWRALASGDTQYPAIVDLERALLPYANGKKPSQLHITRIVAHAWKLFCLKPFAKVNKRSIQGVDEPILICGSDDYTGNQQLNPAQINI